MAKAYNFDVTITSRHEEIEQNLKESVIEQMLKLSKFHSHIINGNVIFDRSNSFCKVEVSVRVPGLTITAVHKDYNQFKAIDSAIEKAKSQIKKLKSKVANHRVPSQTPVIEVSETEESDVIE